MDERRVLVENWDDGRIGGDKVRYHDASSAEPELDRGSEGERKRITSKIGSVPRGFERLLRGME
jgi:hypothetical protein